MVLEEASGSELMYGLYELQENVYSDTDVIARFDINFGKRNNNKKKTKT